MKKYLFFLSVLFAFGTPNAIGQDILNKLRQKARQIADKAVDKVVDKALSKPSAETDKAGTGTSNDPSSPAGSNDKVPGEFSSTSHMIRTDTIIIGLDTTYHFNTSSVRPQDFVAYAISLKGTPYAPGSMDPQYGLDCSGFIAHVFNHFNISVPRRTFDFKNAEKKVPLNEAKPGDIILFTGSDQTQKFPGHMGIITSKGKDLEFVHASSGTKYSVITSLLRDNYFKDRFLAVVRVF